MSTFSGLVPEFPGISIDNFARENLKSKLFFLSHVHSDHMNGLNSWEFEQKILEDGVFLYSSEASTKMLKLWFKQYAQKCVQLPIGIPTLLHLGDDNYFSVTLIPAGHCLGSVMFLIEGKEKNVLYTGDFRFSTNDFSGFKNFYDIGGSLKRIDKVYLDTTFFSINYPEFPSRKASFEALRNIITVCMDNSDSEDIVLETCAIYGYEAIFVEVSQYFSMPIHVSERRYEVYKYFPDMDRYITLDKDRTRLCAYDCGCLYNKSIFIKLSAFYWTQWKSENCEAYKYLASRNSYRVCYSSHPSFKETVDFLQFLKPLEVEANVVPDREKAKEELYRLIEETVAKFRSQSEKPNIQSEDELKMPALAVPKRRKIYKNDDDVKADFHEGDGDVFSLLDSP